GPGYPRGWRSPAKACRSPAHQAPQPATMVMTDGDGQRVDGIIRAGQFAGGKQRLDHFQHLAFGGGSVTRDRELDLVRWLLVDIGPRPNRSEERDATRLS